MKRGMKLVVALGITALILAGCGGGSPANTNSATSAEESTGATTASQQAATVAATTNPELGEILVDGNGRTLYLFEADQNGTSACSGECAQVWPPLTIQGEPKAGEGVSAEKLDTITREDGTIQVAYNGHPLYYYAPDSQPGDTKGEGLEQFGAEWYVVSPSGQKVEEEEGGGGTEDTGEGS